jgi:hypothetical protein
VIHWLLVALVVYAATLVLVAIICMPYLRQRNVQRGHMQRRRRCQRCGHLVEGYACDELDCKEQLQLQMAHAPPVAQRLLEAATRLWLSVAASTVAT